MTISEKIKLFNDCLSSGGISKEELKTLKNSYENTRNKVLSEDMFYEDSSSNVYKCMREADSAYSDYIKALEYRAEYLEAVAKEFATGVAEDNAELMRSMIAEFTEAQKGMEEIQKVAKAMMNLSCECSNQ